MRAAATAWLEPFPPGPSLKLNPSTVSPQAGSFGVRKARSATKIPMMVIGRPAMACSPQLGLTTPFLTMMQP